MHHCASIVFPYYPRPTNDDLAWFRPHSVPATVSQLAARGRGGTFERTWLAMCFMMCAPTVPDRAATHLTSPHVGGAPGRFHRKWRRAEIVVSSQDSRTDHRNKSNCGETTVRRGKMRGG